MGQSSPTVRQPKARRLGGVGGFLSTHKPARAARVACPGNLAALKPPLMSIPHGYNFHGIVHGSRPTKPITVSMNGKCQLEMPPNSWSHTQIGKGQ